MMSSRRALALLVMLAVVATACGSTSSVTATATPTPKVLPADRLIPELVFSTNTAAYDPIRYEASVLIAAEWEKLGLKVKLDLLDQTPLQTKLRTPPFEYNAFVSSYVSRPERLDPDSLMNAAFVCSAVQTTNPTGWCNPEYDKLIAAQRTEMDQAKRKDSVVKAQQVMANDVPILVMYYVTEVHAFNNRLFKSHVPGVAQGLWNIWTMTQVEPTGSERVLKVGQAFDMDHLNPFAPTSGANIETLRLIYDQLARIGPDGTPQPWAAESWKVVDDKTVDVKLRSGMKFHDGSPVTAEDVKFSYDTQKASGQPALKPFLGPIGEIRVVDPLNLRFMLTAPYPALVTAAFPQMYIVPKKVWEGQSDPQKFNNANPIGSGPFKFVHWRAGQEIRLDAVKDHFRAPKIDGVLHVVRSNPDAVFQALRDQVVHMHDRRLLPAHVDQAKSLSYLSTVQSNDFGPIYIGFNTRTVPFSDPAFRRAIAQTIDRKTIIETLLRGLATPGKGIIGPANKFWHDPTQTDYQFDIAKARKALSDAGYEWGADGRLYRPAR